MGEEVDVLEEDVVEEVDVLEEDVEEEEDVYDVGTPHLYHHHLAVQNVKDV